MFLKVSADAKAKLDIFINTGATLVLDLDDGVGEYSKFGVCSLDTSFRMLVLDKNQSMKDYQLPVDSDCGVIYIKDYSKMYLDEAMTLDIDPRLGTMRLSSPSGVIDSHVQIVDLRVKVM